MENYQNKEWLQQQLDELGSGRAIAKKFGIGKTTIAKWIKKHKLSKEPKRKQEKKYYQNKEWLTGELKKRKSTEMIASEIGISERRLFDIFQEEGIPVQEIRRKENRFRDPEWLRENFKKYKNIKEFGRATGHDYHNLSKYLKMYGIYEHPTYTVSSAYFKSIDSEEKAYWLGFIMADSTMTSYQSPVEKKYSFKLKLALIDKEAVEDFKKAVNGNAPVREETGKREGFKDTYQASFSVNDQEFCKNLISHGITERRTGKKFLPDTVPYGLVPHFIRGYFDGDGSIRYQYHEKPNGTHKYIRGLVIACSEPIFETIKNIYLEIGVTEDAIKSKEMKDCTTISLYRKDEIPKVVEYLYKDATVFLDRKYQVAKNYLN